MLVAQLIKRRKIYVANKDEIVNDMHTYLEPFEVSTTINSVSGSQEILAYGDRTFNMLRLVLDYDYLDKISENDMAYVYADHTDDNEYCLKADYKVESVRPQNLKTIVYLERNLKK